MLIQLHVRKAKLCETQTLYQNLVYECEGEMPPQSG